MNSEPSAGSLTDSDLRAKLQQDAGIVEWRLLQPHYDRGALINVQVGLDLIEVALQISKDNKQAVEQWIAEAAINKPTPAQAQEWQEEDTRFRSLVVAPFVLMQHIPH